MKSTLWLLLLLWSVTAVAQTPSISALEQQAAGQDGEALIRTSNALSDAHREAGNWSAAVTWADRMANAAQRSQAIESLAQAYYQKGRAYATADKKAQRTRAFKAFEDAAKLTRNADFKKTNWEATLRLAQVLDKSAVVEKAQTELALLAGESPTDTGGGGLFGRRKRNATEAQAESQTALAALSGNQAEMERNQARLFSALADKEAALQEMSEAQMRQEVLFMEQNRLLDSMRFLSLADSLYLSNQSIALAQQELQIQQQTTDLERYNNQRKVWLLLAGLGVLLAGGWWHRHQSILQYNKQLEEKNAAISAEKQRSETLLLNILPLAIANELKTKGAASARHYDRATVLFTDFKGFSKIAQQLPPNELVEALDYAFKAFDDIIVRHGLEKIKTIGDAYMCAGGLPGVDENHPKEVVQAALDIQAFLHHWNHTRQQAGQPAFEARIGIHTGPLVAGVVGFKKFAYDIWGDTVNIASRMESSGQAGRVNISDATYALVKPHFRCQPRGFVEVKNIGEVEMYFVEG